jgi:hypothetical protein
MDWQDAARVQAPGAPYRKFSWSAAFYPDQGTHGRWEADRPAFVPAVGSLTISPRAATGGAAGVRFSI